MNKKKTPKVKENPSPTKQPKIASSPTSYHHLKPAWRLSIIETAELYGWHTLDRNKLIYIKDKLTAFESMTWAEILVKGKKFNHAVEVRELCKDAQNRLEAIRQNDIDELVSLRLSGIERVWGILDQGILTLLWWDPDHSVCPSLPKNT